MVLLYCTVLYLSVHGDSLQIQMGFSQHSACRSLIHTSRLDSDETVLHNVNSPHTVSTWWMKKNI